MSSELIVASRNLHKIEEIREMLPGWRVRGVEAIPEAPEVEETGATFQENAALKALALSSLTEALVLADDSGLEVDALGGEPGVHSARYAGRHGDDAGNNAKLLRELRGVPGDERRARFRCAIVLARGGVELARFDGAVEGRILAAERGAGGFGYDPLFAPEGYEESFAELGAEVKNGMSHRARAVEKVRAFLERRQEGNEE